MQIVLLLCLGVVTELASDLLVMRLSVLGLDTKRVPAVEKVLSRLLIHLWIKVG
jgi:hypothetical protein